MSRTTTTVLAVTGIGCGLNAGVFFAFSSSVMSGLRRLPPAQGVAAMQSINVTAVRPAFMTALFGTAVGCLTVCGVAVRGERTTTTVLALTGAALYLVGTIGVTIAANVPRNDTLAALDPHAPGTPAAWVTYLDSWTAWNSLRTVAALAAAVALAAAAVASTAGSSATGAER